MSECPKCGVGRMRGPIYNPKSDRLVYHCERCGYVESRLPCDRIPVDDELAAWMRGRLRDRSLR